MRQKCKFSRIRDFRQVAPNLSINLSQALESKSIPATGTDVEFNEIESSANIGDRVRDCFEAIEAQRAITALGKAIAAQEKADKAAKVAAEKAAAEKAAAAAAAASTQSSEGAN